MRSFAVIGLIFATLVCAESFRPVTKVLKPAEYKFDCIPCSHCITL